MASRRHHVRIRLQAHHVAHRIAWHDLHYDEHDHRRDDQRGSQYAKTPEQIRAAESTRDANP